MSIRLGRWIGLLTGRAFSGSGATRAVELDISKAFDRVWHDGMSAQNYPVYAGIPQGSILGPPLLLLYINGLSDDVICNIAIYVDDTTLCCKCNQVSNLWQQLDLATELESDLWDSVDWGRCLVHFNAGKTEPVSFDWSTNSGAIDMKSDKSALGEISSFKMVGLSLFSNWIGALTLSPLLKLPLIVLIPSVKFLFPEVARYRYKSTIRLRMVCCCQFDAPS